MKNNQSDQLNNGKSGGKPNQKTAQTGGKKENEQPVKKGNPNVGDLDQEEMEEGTTIIPQSKHPKTEGKTGNKRENL